MRQPSFSDFWDDNVEQAIENIRERYEPDEDEINDELTDMYEDALDEWGDAEYERRRDEEWDD